MVLAEGTLEINSKGAEEGVRNVKKELLGVRDSLSQIQKESKNSVLFGQRGIRGELMHASSEFKEFFKYGLVGVASGFLSPVIGGLISQLSEPLMDAGMKMLGLGDAAEKVEGSLHRQNKELDEQNKKLAEVMAKYHAIADAHFRDRPESPFNVMQVDKQLTLSALTNAESAKVTAARQRIDVRQSQVDGDVLYGRDDKSTDRIRIQIGADEEVIRAAKERIVELRRDYEKESQRRTNGAMGRSDEESRKNMTEADKKRSELQAKWETEDRDSAGINTVEGARAFAQRELDEFNRNKFERQRTFGSDQREFNVGANAESTGRTAFEGIEAYSRKIQERADDSAARAEKQRAELIQQGEEIKRANREFANAVIGKLGVQ